jgi:hypothetical protein
MNAAPIIQQGISNAASSTGEVARNMANAAKEAAVAATPVVVDAAKRAMSSAKGAAVDANAKAFQIALGGISTSKEMAKQMGMTQEGLKAFAKNIKSSIANTPEKFIEYMQQAGITPEKLHSLLLSNQLDEIFDLPSMKTIGNSMNDWIKVLTDTKVNLSDSASSRESNRGNRLRSPDRNESNIRKLRHAMRPLFQMKGMGLDVPASAKPKAKAKAKRAPKKLVKPVIEYHDLKDNPYVMKPKLQLPEKPSKPSK